MGRGFESRPDRKLKHQLIVNQFVEFFSFMYLYGYCIVLLDLYRRLFSLVKINKFKNTLPFSVPAVVANPLIKIPFLRYCKK